MIQLEYIVSIMIKMRKAEKPECYELRQPPFLTRPVTAESKKISVNHLTLTSPLKVHLSVVCCFFRLFLWKQPALLFLQSANYSPKTSSTKNRMATNAFISSLSLLGGKSDDQIAFKTTFIVEYIYSISIQTDVFNLIEGLNLNWRKKKE